MGIADWDRFQRIEEFDKNNWEVPEGKTENFMIIELTIFPGRSREQKKIAIEKITGLLCEPDVRFCFVLLVRRILRIFYGIGTFIHLF
ncbi:MAG: tautomerase family protein [Treponema sp.]|nr:tautomerase family protein [Treponema sp.]